MVFKDSTNNAGLCDDIDFLVNSDDNSYPLADKCRNINRAYDEAVAAILESDGRWQFDDLNATDLPIGTTPLVANQQDYSFSSEFLTISRIEIQDQFGNWKALKPIDEQDVIRDGSSLTDFQKQPGQPEFYDKRGNSLFLYPAPSYSQDASLKAYFQRNISYFVPTDTDKTPGFNQQFHRILSVRAALDYAISKDLSVNKIKMLTSMSATLLEGLKAAYARKSKDENIGLKARRWKFF